MQYFWIQEEDHVGASRDQVCHLSALSPKQDKAVSPIYTDGVRHWDYMFRRNYKKYKRQLKCVTLT
jgi:hypothetical protein